MLATTILLDFRPFHREVKFWDGKFCNNHSRSNFESKQNKHDNQSVTIYPKDMTHHTLKRSLPNYSQLVESNLISQLDFVIQSDVKNSWLSEHNQNMATEKTKFLSTSILAPV